MPDSCNGCTPRAPKVFNSRVEELGDFLSELREHLETRMAQETQQSYETSQRGPVHRVLADVRNLECESENVKHSSTISVIGRSYVQNAKLINALCRLYQTEYLSSQFSRDVEGDGPQYVLYNGHVQLTELPSYHIQQLLARYGVSREGMEDITVPRVLPIIEDVKHTHIVYKVRFGTHTKVRVLFESVGMVERLLSMLSNTNARVVNEEMHLQALVRSTRSGSADADAATFFTEIEASKSCTRRVIALKNLIASDAVHCTSDGNMASWEFLLGKWLKYVPDAGGVHNVHLDRDISRMSDLVHQFSTVENDLWSIVKEIIIEIPSNSPTANGVSFATCALTELLNVSSTKTAGCRSILNECHTIIHVCDERRMDGDLRNILQSSHFLRSICHKSNKYCYFAVVLDDTPSEDANIHCDQVRLAKEAEIRSIFEASLTSNVFPSSSFWPIDDKRFKLAFQFFVWNPRSDSSEIIPLQSAINECLLRNSKFAQDRFTEIENSTVALCDRLQSHFIIPFKQSDEKQICLDFMEQQVMSTITQVISGQRLYNYLNNGLSETCCSRWYKALSRVFRVCASDLLRCMIRDSIAATKRKNTWYSYTRGSELLEIGRKRKTRDTRHITLPLVLVICGRAMSKYSQILERLLKKMQAINAGQLNAYFKHFDQWLDQGSMHPATQYILKFSIRGTLDVCVSLFMDVVTDDWFSHAFLSCALDALQVAYICIDKNELECVENLLIDVTSAAYFDLVALMNTRLLALRQAHEASFMCLFDLKHMLISLRQMAAHAKLCQHLPCPLYTKSLGMVVWNVPSFRNRDDLCVSSVLKASSDSLHSDYYENYTITLSRKDVIPSSLLIPGEAFHINRVITEALIFIERESMKRDTFLQVWGSDLLATLYFFRENTYGCVKNLCHQLLLKFVTIWRERNAKIPSIDTIEDFLYYNEGCYVLRRLGMEHDSLWRKIQNSACRWDLQVHLGLDESSDTKTRKHINYDQLSTALIWSFFLHENGLNVPGTSPRDVDKFCERIGAMSDQFKYVSASNFRNKCYFVTHRVFTRSSWCRFALLSEKWKQERQFLKYFLPVVIEADDIELVGEFIQALRCLGIKDSDDDVWRASRFIINSRNVVTGGWLSCDAPFETQYHATVCCIGMNTVWCRASILFQLQARFLAINSTKLKEYQYMLQSMPDHSVLTLRTSL